MLYISTFLLSATFNLAEINEYAYFYGKEYGVEPKLIMAIIKVESNFNPKAVGRSHGERGLMQLRPNYHTASFEPSSNIKEGTAYLAKLKKRFSPKYGKAWFICYNMGPTACKKRAISLDAAHKNKYYTKVMRAYAKDKSKDQDSQMRIARCTGSLCN